MRLGTYLALLDGDPFLDPGLDVKGPRQDAMVFGLLGADFEDDDPEDDDPEAAL